MRIALAFLAAAGLAAQTSETALRWMELGSGEVEVNGLAWYAQNHGELVRLPQQLTEEERALWEKLGRVSRFNPRTP